ncbi:MAG TPA: hypothetical protein VKS19_09825 [Verrucomicrobiae bacterium]|nr:hypothetical protein [Verrucomicrobiae bacterium]
MNGNLLAMAFSLSREGKYFTCGRLGLNFPVCKLSKPVALVELVAGRREWFCFFAEGKIGGTIYAVLSDVFSDETMKRRGESKGSIKSF